MMAWQNPQQAQMWPVRTAPANWAGAWPPPAPGAIPPPAPPGVDASRWMTGSWKFNPSFQANASMPMQAWAPHPSWGAAVANFNPYKRIPNPGDAAYWATKLSDNPLGLSNMLTAGELAQRKKQAEEMLEHQHPADHAQHTPWVWVPKDLSPEDEPAQSSSTAREYSAEPSPSRHNHHDHHSQHLLRQSSTHRQGSSSTSDARSQAPAQGSAAPQSAQMHWPGGKPPNQEPYEVFDRDRDRRNGHGPTNGAPSSAPAGLSSFSEQARRRYATAPEPAQSSADTTINPPRSWTEDPQVFSTSKQLKPTFSPSIVRTPDYYSGVSTASAAAAAADSPHRPRHNSTSTPHRRSSSSRPRDIVVDRDDDDSPPPRPHFHGPIYGPPTPTPPRTRTTSSTTNDVNRSSLSSLTGSMSSLSVSTDVQPPNTEPAFLSSFSEEPAGLLSPLVGITSGPPVPEKTGRELGRSQTYPSISSSASIGGSFPAIPEESSTGGQISRSSSSRTDHSSPAPSPRRQPRTPRTPNSVGRSYTYPSLGPSDEPPVVPPYPSPSTQRASPARSSSLSFPHNPLPPPPRDLTGLGSSSASAAAASQGYHSRDATSTSRTSPRTQQPLERQLTYPTYPTSGTSQSLSSSSSSAAAYASTASAYPTTSSAVSQPQAYTSNHSSYPTTATHVSSASTASLSTTTAPAPPTRPRPKTRIGFWNQRGDHLVETEVPSSSSPSRKQKVYYVVYAPAGQTYPEELQSYPAPEHAWRDHRGTHMRHDPKFEEYPDSLPKRGRPPKTPYESFVTYM